MGSTGSAETTVVNYLSTLRNIPEQRRTLYREYYEDERMKQLYVFLIRLMMVYIFQPKHVDAFCFVFGTTAPPPIGPGSPHSRRF